MNNIGNEIETFDGDSVALGWLGDPAPAPASRYPERDQHKQRRWSKQIRAVIIERYHLSNL